ncbi:hypothetical protein [Natrinema gari]|uniref:Uncharacterized protein n=1 Tax=Natrinema gari JCM 14663 TaxID=1230459 RepID=L9YSP7_9EURY|nr:hypothetical protein [Natrinema gari]ELY77144.1 hypothetical protein C486_16885 [Natrinema gari JCM 14663]
MSTDQQATQPIRGVQLHSYDPLADVGDDQVLRCRDPETDWLWFYDIRGSEVRKHHEYHDYTPRPVSRTDAAETTTRESVEADSISRAHLDVRTGDLDGC